MEEVLPFAPRTVREIDGMGRTMVIAGKTGGAQSIVEPLRHAVATTRHIAHGTHLAALATAQACRRIDGELIVGHPMLDEERTKQFAVGARPTTLVEVAHATPAIYNFGDQAIEPGDGSSNLALGAFGCIDLVDEREIVGFGHDDRKHAVEHNSNSLEVIAQIIECQAHIIATGGESIAVLPLITLQIQPSDKVPDNEWRPPTVNGKAESQALIGIKVVSILAIDHSLGNGHKTVASGIGQPRSDETGVARACEIEYHSSIGIFPIIVTWGRRESSPGLVPGSPSGTAMPRRE